MPNDNDISTILLLVLVGVAIYFLLCSNNHKKPKKEGFEDTVAASSEQNIPVNYSENVMADKQLTSADFAASAIAPYAVDVEEPSDKSTALDSSIFNFSGHDENEPTEWATLNAAFAPVLAESTNPDVVDFNRGNVDNYDSKDFLPKEVNDEWFDTDFSLAKYQLNDDKLINTDKYIVGVNTVGQSHKNATWDIRGTIPNPKFSVGPWGNSTIEPDMSLKSLC